MSQRILVVDDNVDAAESLSLLLGFLSYEVKTAFNGAEAIEVAAEFKPDLIILDINMPVMDGYEAARTFRGSPAYQRTVLVALTACGTARDRAQALEAGFDLHLIKPADFSQVSHVVEKMLGQRA